MAVPKKKSSRMRKGNRNSGKALRKLIVVEDSTTGELKRPHHISRDGYYNGRQVTTARVAR